MISRNIAVLALIAGLIGQNHNAHALVFDFQFNQNADLEGGTNSGSDDLGTNWTTVTGIAVGDGTTIHVTATSAPGHLNSADNGIGVHGGNGAARLGIGESVALSFNRNVTVTGFTLNEKDAGENSTYSTPTSGGTKTNTSASVTGLSLPLAAGQMMSFSTTVGDGIRIATLTVILPMNDFFTVDGNSTDNILPVLANDAGSGLTLLSVTDPANGAAVISGTAILYSPDIGFIGTDIFNYTTLDILGSNVTLTVTVTVSKLIPDNFNDCYQVLSNSGSNRLDVLRNDENSGVTLVSITPPTNGTAVISGANVIYSPAMNYTGADRFTYTTQDGLGSNDTWTVTVDVRQYPNFVFILSDDQGWTGLSVRMNRNRADSMSDYHRTPRMENLAAEGMRFSCGYSPHPNCSPSRYANLTGMTCARLKMTDIVGRSNNPVSGKFKLISPGKAVDAIQSARFTTPELLKSIPGAGYSAAHFGKWHLDGGGPVAHGFDADANDGETGNGAGGAGPEPINDDPKRVYTVTDRSLDYLNSRVTNGTPFYLQISHYAMHEPTQTKQSTYDTFNGVPKGTWHSNQYYAAMAADLDINVGRVLDRIDALGIRNSTYLFYQADNGAPQSQSENYPLRGYKPEVWEGGTRTPTFVRGPGVLADSQCDLPVMGIDILPTIWEWATHSTANLPADVDGGSLVATIQSISQGSNTPIPVVRGGEVVHHSPHYIGPSPWPDDWQLNPKDMRPRSTLHIGNYKLVANYEPGTVELYNLTTDIGEQSNLSAAELAVKWQMWVRLRDYLKLVQAQMPTLDPSYPGTTNGTFVLAANTGPLGDADADGLNDDWEFSELLTYASNGGDDTDQDGVANADELVQGTDPLLPNAITISHLSANTSADELHFEWKGVPGEKYAIEYSEDLAGWSTISTVLSGDGFDLEATVLTSGNKGFYRIRRL